MFSLCITIHKLSVAEKPEFPDYWATVRVLVHCETLLDTALARGSFSVITAFSTVVPDGL